MESFNSMHAFVQVVESGSFTEAARSLRVPKSTLSRRIARLEDRLGVQLLVRTTRRVGTTEVGAAYYERSRKIVEEIREAEEAVLHMSEVPRGLLRVTAPARENHAIGELISSFMVAHPEVVLEVLTANRFVDLSEEGFDVAIRAGTLKESSLIARRLATGSVIMVASPEYLARRGEPENVKALGEHDGLVREYHGTGWSMTDGRTASVKVRLRANSLSVLRHASIDGHGLALLPEAVVREDLKAGTLTRVLADDFCQSGVIYAVYPPSRHLSPKVRAFVDFAVSFFADVQA
jgi:DNA-binding transcriptional LysR family regulator